MNGGKGSGNGKISKKNSSNHPASSSSPRVFGGGLGIVNVFDRSPKSRGSSPRSPRSRSRSRSGEGSAGMLGGSFNERGSGGYGSLGKPPLSRPPKEKEKEKEGGRSRTASTSIPISFAFGGGWDWGESR